MGFFKYKWGESGDGLETPPATTQADGTASEQEGFGSRYSLLYDPTNPSLSNPNAIPLHRKLLNAILNKITGGIQQYQTVGIPNFITSSDNGGTPYPYSIGSVCILNGIEYRSLTSNNTTTPPSSSWEQVKLSVIDSTSSLVSSSAVATNAFFTGVTASAFVSIKIVGLPTITTGGVLDFGGMIVKIMQDDRDANGTTIPDSWVLFIKGDMKNGVWENAQAINVATSSSVALSVNFTRTATDAYVEFDFTTLGISYMSVVVESINTYAISGYIPSISISKQTSKLGTLATDFVRQVIGSQPLNSILTALTNNNLPIVNFINSDANSILKTGVYMLGTGNTNTPSGGSWLFSMYWSSANAFQLCWDTGGGMWSRYLLGTTWSQWIKLQPSLSQNFGFPSWTPTGVTYTAGTVYQATQPLLLVFSQSSTSTATNTAVIGYVGNTSSPATIIAEAMHPAVNSLITLSMEVKTGDFFKITVSSGAVNANTYVAYPIILT